MFTGMDEEVLFIPPLSPLCSARITIGHFYLFCLLPCFMAGYILPWSTGILKEGTEPYIYSDLPQSLAQGFAHRRCSINVI